MSCLKNKIITNSLGKNIFLFLLLLCPYFIFSQQFLFSPSKDRQQLNEEKIRNFIELSDGRIGVFTERMLNIYDGDNFKTIEIDDNFSVLLPSYRGFHHSYQENDHIWFKDRGKINLINISKERCELQPLKYLKSLGFKGAPADLFLDQTKKIWVLNTLGHLMYYDPKSKKNVTFLKNVNIAKPSDTLYDLISNNKNVFLVYKSGMIRCFDNSAKEIYKKRIVSNDNGNFTLWNHAAIVNNFIYVVRAGYFKGQLVRFDINTKEFKIVLQADTYWLNTFAANHNGDFIMSCSRGLWYFSSGSLNGTLFTELPLADNYKLKTEVSTVLYDRQGGLWLGTLNKGIYYYHPDRSKFKYYQKRNFQLESSNEFQVNSFEETNDGKLLIGTNDGLFKADFPLENSKLFKVLLANLYCNSLYKDSNGYIWISSNSGLYVLDPWNKLHKYTSQATHYVLETKKKEIYICTTTGISKWNHSYDSFDCRPLKNAPSNILQLIQSNNLLIGISYTETICMKETSSGLILASITDKENIPAFNQKKYKCSSILEDSEGDLWLGTYNGLKIWNKRKRKFYILNIENGLINNSIKSIVEDKGGSFWVTTSRGVSKIFKKYTQQALFFKIINYDKYDGVLEYPFADRAAFISQKSGLFIGGIDGMNNLPDSMESAKKDVLTPVFINFRLFGKNVAAGEKIGGDIVLKKAMPHTDTLKLKYNQNFFSIGISGLNFKNPTRTYYRYRLENIDHEWRITKSLSGSANIHYTNVSPGKYFFKAQASADGLNWGGKENKLLIIIEPPIWKTIYAKIGYCLLLLLSIFITTKSINRRNRLIRKKQQEDAIEIAKSDFITNMSHELRTPLTLVITPLKALIGKVENQELKKDLLRISTNSDLLLDTVNQLLDFKKIDTGEEKLHCHFYDNLSFLTEICEAYLSVASQKGILFSWNVDNQNSELYIDRQKITRIVLNLLSNAVKFTLAGQQVTLTAVIDNDKKELIITVNDSGSGISETEIDKIFGRFYQADHQNSASAGSGLGLFIVKYYAEMHGGSATVESILGQGTSFRVELSVQEKAQHSSWQQSERQITDTILIIEDQNGFRNYLAEELKNQYYVLTASNGQEGLDMAVDKNPDVIITDMIMPVMDGVQLCHSVRNTISVSHIPIIMLTARASDQARFDGYLAGADAYIVKPFDINLLRLRIKNLLEKNNYRRQSFIEEKSIKTDTLTDNPIDKEFLERAFKCVEKNLSNSEYSVEKFSLDMNMERTGLYRKLIALTDHSPNNFIRTMRLKKASDLLLDKHLSITDVAEQTGFNSISYFTKCFHDAFGKTPGQSREENSSKN